jgi:tyrosine-protein kinase
VKLAELLWGMRRHLLLLVITTLCGAGAALTWTVAQPPVYESRATVFVSVPQAMGGDLDQAYQGSLFTQERVRSYADLVGTPRVTGPIIKELGLRTTPAALAERLTAKAPVDTVLLDITAQHRTPKLAAAIVNSATRHLIDAVSDVEGSSAIRLHVVRPGPAPTIPSSPRPLLNLALGLIAGLLAGLGGVLLRDALDTRLGRPEDIAAVFTEPVLGSVPYEPAKRKTALSDPFGVHAEAFRMLRTNLSFLRVDAPPRSIAVTSPAQGCGKSSTALNLAFSLADNGSRVVLVDADLRRPTVAKTLGLVAEVGLTTVLSGRIGLVDALQEADRGSVIKVLTSGALPPNPSELLSTHQFRQVMTELRAIADYVIVDAAPVLTVSDGAIVAAAVDGTIVIVRTGRTRREELRRAVVALTSVNATVLGLVANMVPRRRRSAYYYYYYGETSVARSAKKARKKGLRDKRRTGVVGVAPAAGRVRDVVLAGTARRDDGPAPGGGDVDQ